MQFFLTTYTATTTTQILQEDKKTQESSDGSPVHVNSEPYGPPTYLMIGKWF